MKRENRGSILKPVMPKPEPPIPGWKTRALERGEILRRKGCVRLPRRGLIYRTFEMPIPPASNASHGWLRGLPSRDAASRKQLVVTIFSVLLAVLRPS